MYLPVRSQVKTNFNNETIIYEKGHFDKQYGEQKVDLEIPSKNIKELLEAEKNEAAGLNYQRPFMMANATNVDINIPDQIKWIYEDDFAYGKFVIRAIGALSTSINFDKFFLPDSTQLFIYNQNGNMITGPVTENENNAVLPILWTS